MTDKEKLEHEIKVLKEATKIIKGVDLRSDIQIVIHEKINSLAELTKPKFKDGTLGRLNGNKPIYVYGGLDERYKPGFEPLPIETILRHLAPEGCDSWRYVSKNSVSFFKQGWSTIDDNTGQFRIPAPYREDWENISGEL
jgi:hypothetical protein